MLSKINSSKWEDRSLFIKLFRQTNTLFCRTNRHNYHFLDIIIKKKTQTNNSASVFNCYSLFHSYQLDWKSTLFFFFGILLGYFGLFQSLLSFVNSHNRNASFLRLGRFKRLKKKLRKLSKLPRVPSCLPSLWGFHPCL